MLSGRHKKKPLPSALRFRGYRDRPISANGILNGLRAPGVPDP